MCHWQTTGNSSVAMQTGSTYICDSMTDITIIPTANLLSEWVRRKYQQVTVTSMTTGNSDIADKTGNSYAAGTTTHSAEIPTASQVFLTTVSPNKVSPSDYDNVRQPEMVLRPLKPEILISLESREVGWQFQRQIWGFRPHPARINWHRAIATSTDNRTW